MAASALETLSPSSAIPAIPVTITRGRSKLDGSVTQYPRPQYATLISRRPFVSVSYSLSANRTSAKPNWGSHTSVTSTASSATSSANIARYGGGWNMSIVCGEVHAVSLRPCPLNTLRIIATTVDTVPSKPSGTNPSQCGEIGNFTITFNAYGAYLGCDTKSHSGCVYEISGYVYDSTSDSEALAYQGNVTLLGCPELRNCALQYIKFDHGLRGVTGLQIRAFDATGQRIWFLDDLQLGWSDDSCAAGRVRAASRRRLAQV
ncbi:hypothetical protein ANO11243_035780 [Dothideomycetidae sp. 11243]|nr:hypothetical protein ANO11243_035780 [fungal sp. No.11243]